MQYRWALSKFYLDPVSGEQHPVASAYAANTRFPERHREWALVELQCDSHQLEAAKTDPRIVVCPLLFALTPLPKQVTDAYLHVEGVSEGMTLNALLAVLAEVEPIYGHDDWYRLT